MSTWNTYKVKDDALIYAGDELNHGISVQLKRRQKWEGIEYGKFFCIERKGVFLCNSKDFLNKYFEPIGEKILQKKI